MSQGKVLTSTLLLLGLVLVLAIPMARQCPAQAPAPAKVPPTQWSKLTGPELIKALQVERTRLKALRELARRGGYKDWELLDCAELYVCPQDVGQKTVYAVLTRNNYDYKASLTGENPYRVEKAEELFGEGACEVAECPFPRHGPYERFDMIPVLAFDEDGSPTDGDALFAYITNGFIGDFNGDGRVEYVQTTNYGGDAGPAAMLVVRAVTETKTQLLNVLYDLGREEWDYQFVDHNGDGIAEIEFGPVVAGELKPKVTFTWDKVKKAYVGPEVKADSHFRLLTSDDATPQGSTWDEILRLKKEGVVFPPDPDAVGGRQQLKKIWVDGIRRGSSSPKEPAIPTAPPPPRPYRYASLKGLTHEQIRAYMGKGAEATDRSTPPPPRRLPENFWTMPPRDAAVALVDAIRTAEDRANSRLAVDDRDGKKPPEACTVYYSYCSPGDYFVRDVRCFLRVDRAGSYFAYSCASAVGWVLRSSLDVRPSYDLRRVDLGYDEARRISDVLWYLNRVRSPGSGSSRPYSEGWSSADGDGALVLSSLRGREIDLTGRITWFRATGPGHNYGPQDLVNLADWLLPEAVPDHLGGRWKAQDPAPELATLWGFPLEPKDAKGNPEETQRRAAAGASAQVARLIGLFSVDQSRLAHYVLLDAVQVAGDFALAEYVPLLKAMQKELPAPAGHVRTAAEVRELMLKAFEAEKAEGGDFTERKDSIKLMDEWQALRQGTVPESAKEELRLAIELALRKIDTANDVDRMSAWAQSHDEGARWALIRLKRKDKKRYVAALEWWIDHSEGEWARRFFDEIRWVDPERAKALAARVAADGPHPLTVPAYSVLDEAKTITDRDKRIDALIAVALDPKNRWDQRREAVELLVPPDEPLRYPDRKIDDALVKLLDPALADEVGNWTLKEACRGLALRGRIELFDKIAAVLSADKDMDPRDEILSSLVLLAQSGSPEHRAKLLGIIAPELKVSGRMTSNIVECAYGADLRELKGDVARVATLSAEDHESPNTMCSEPQPVTGHWHVARKVAAIWNEEDPLTRGKLLVGFGFEQGEGPYGPGPAALATRKNLADLAKTLPPADAKQLVEFVAWYEKERVKSYKDVDPKTPFGDFVRKTFGGGQ